MSLSYGNKLFRERKYKEALVVYESLLESINSNSILAETINLNIQLVKNSLNETDSDLNYDFANISAKESFGSANIAFKLFDKDFYEKSLYEQNFKHTCKSKLDYFNHFLDYGEAKGFQPNPAFSSIEYKSCNSDLFPSESPSGCYKHFISSGAVEKRRYWRKASSQHHNEFFRFKVIESHLINWNELKQRAFQSDLVSIIIPVFGEPNLLEKCVESIYASQSSLKYEVVLVDNKKDRETTNVINTLSEKYQNITIQSNLFNYNFALGCNSGLLQAKGSHLIFLNTDTVVEDYWIDKLIRPLNNPFIRAVQPKLVYSKNKIQSIGTALSNWSYMPFELYKNEPATARHVSYSRPFNIVTAACIAVRTTDFVRVNGFNTQYINGCEDIDLCLKLIENYKYQCWYESSVTIRHYESKSSGRGMWNEVNRIFFVKNWMHDLKPDLNQYLDQDGISVDFVVDSRKRQSRRIHSCYPEKYFHNSSKISKDSPLLTSITQPKNSDICENQSDICIFSSQVSSFNNKPTVLLIGHIAGRQMFGGERSFIDMIEALSSLEINIVVSLPNKPSEEYQDIILKYAIKMYVFPYKWWRPLEQSGRIESQIFHDICKFDAIDFIYVNTIMPHSYQLASKELAIPSIIHVRELMLDDDTFQKRLGIPTRDIISQLSQRSDYIIANSIATSQMFQDNSSVKVARNIVELSKFSLLKSSDNSTIKFGMISSNISKKGIHDFFRLASLSKGLKNVQFLLIGPLTKDVQDLLLEYDSDRSNINVLGYIADSVQAIQKVDVVLSLSKFSESFGRTIAEGFAAKKPSLAYDRGAVSELVIDGKTGFLIPQDDLKIAYETIVKISENPLMLSEMGDNALTHLRNICSKDQLKRGIAHALIMSWIKKRTLDKGLYRRSENIVSRILQNPHSVKSIFKCCSKAVTIIIPIFNAFDDIKICINSVLSTCDYKNVSILLINDCSTDARVLPYLQSLVDRAAVTVVSNSTNIGYTKTINKAIQIAGDSDVLLLNSDTVVNNDWLIQLQLAAYSSDDVATVTPLSNNAGAFSFPTKNENNIIPPQLTLNDAARRIVLDTQDHEYQSLPTGNGFCMYIKRKALDIVGLFDSELFPRGYGEENHFCMRVLQHQMINLLCPHAYIFHIKTASFKGERTKLIDEGQKALIKAFPSYPRRVKRDFNTPKFNAIRDSVRSTFQSFPGQLN